MFQRSHIPPVLLPVIALISVSCWAADFENAPSLQAADFFKGIPLEGKHYTIDAEVPTDGFMTRTVIRSDFGDFIASGPDMLQIRLHDIDALVKLQTLEASDEFKQGASESANEKINALKHLYHNPDEAAGGLGEGVSRFFKRAYRSGKTGVQKVDDVIHKRTPGSLDSDSPGTALPGWAIEDTKGETVSKYERVARATGGLAADLLGFDESRRKLAKQLAVDPYTTNSVLDAKLDEVTWSIFAGDLGVDIATSLIPGSFLLSTSSMVESLVWDSPPGALLVKIEQSLLGLGIDQDTVDRMLRHQYYPLSYQTVLVAALESLADVDGLPEIMPLVLSVTTVDQARFIGYTLRMLAKYHQDVARLETLQLEGTIVAIDKKGRLVITAPLDYISWSPELDQFSQRELFQRHEIHFYVTRELSELARQKLRALGWSTYENSPLFESLIPSTR